MKLSKLLLIFTLISILISTAYSADPYKDVKPWQELNDKIRHEVNRNIIFWKDMDYNIKGEIPKNIKRRYSRDFIFIISPLEDWKPIFFAVNKKLFKKRVGKPCEGMRMLIKGRVKVHSTASRHKKIFVVDVSNIAPYFNFEPVSESEVNTDEYKKADMVDIRMEFLDRIDEKVYCDARFGRLTILEDKFSKVMGLDSEEWAMLYLNEESEERLPFFLNKEEQKKSYEIAKDLKRDKPVKIYGRVLRRFDWRSDKAGIVVDKIVPYAESKLPKNVSDKIEDRAADNNKHQEIVQADNNEINYKRDAVEKDFIKTAPLEIKKEINKFKDKAVTFTHVYRGFIPFPQKIAERIGPISGRKWLVLRNKATDLEGVIAIFEENRGDIKDALESLEPGDNLQVSGDVRFYEKGFRKKIFIIVDSVKIN